MPEVKLNKGDRVFMMDIQDRRCEISNYHYATIRDFLSANGFNDAKSLDDADAVLLNACAGVDEIVELGEMFIGKILKYINGKPFFNVGCLSVISANPTKTESVIPINPKKMREIENYFEHTIPFSAIKPEREIVTKSYQAGIKEDDQFVLISQGCINACSYCNIKRVKGNVKSRPEQDIIEDVKRIIDKGHFTITLLGDDCGSYGIDRQTNLADLVSRLLNIDDRLMLKLSNVYPSHFLDNYEKLKEAFRAKRILYLGVSVQSGSPKILRLMNRNYDLELLKAYLREIKKFNPEIHLYSHFIFNFPTETMIDFEETLSFSKLFDFSLIIGFCENKQVKSYSILPKCTKKEYNQKVAIINEKSTAGEINAWVATAFEIHEPALNESNFQKLKADNTIEDKIGHTLTIHRPEEVLSQIGIKVPAHNN